MKKDKATKKKSELMSDQRTKGIRQDCIDISRAEALLESTSINNKRDEINKESNRNKII